MPKILFKNNKRWKNVFGYLYNKEEELYEKIQLVKSNGYYVLEYNNVHDHVYFSNDIKQTTPKIYLGSFDLVITYKYNSLLNKDTIYFLEQNGQIETLYLESEYLSYRKNEKKVDIYLPFNFDINKKYGVFYFFDSQNLFNMELGYTNNFDKYGGWQVDKILALSKEDFIIVGIDNSDYHRTCELNIGLDKFGPASDINFDLLMFKEGKLDKLLDFINEVVHPLIKSKYNIDEKKLGLGGASMGGLAAFYGGLRDLGKYKYVLSYSPASGVYSDEAWGSLFEKCNFVKNSHLLPKIHLYCGNNDELEKELNKYTKKQKNLLVKYGYLEKLIKETYVDEFMHNEISWRLMLPSSLSFFTNNERN